MYDRSLAHELDHWSRLSGNSTTHIKDIQREGRSFLRIMLEGTSDKTYVAKRTDTASWNWLPVMLRSLSMPYSRALPIFTPANGQQ